MGDTSVFAVVEDRHARCSVGLSDALAGPSFVSPGCVPSGKKLAWGKSVAMARGRTVHRPAKVEG